MTCIDDEIWNQIQGFEDSYEISNRGRARSTDHVVPYENRRRTA